MKSYLISTSSISFFLKIHLLLFLLFLSLQSSAQQLPFAHLSIADGLEDTVIFAIEQDDLGFLWIATRTGINRFDGEKFWTYGQDDGLPHNLARDLLKTSDGTLWVASERGLAWFDGTRFHTLNDWPNKASARNLSEAPDGTLWVATYGAGVVQVQTGKSPKILTNFDYKAGLKSDRVRSVLADKDGNIWAGTSKYVLKIANNKVEQIQWNAEKSEIRSFYQHTDGSIWAGTRHGVARYSGDAFEQLNTNVNLSKQTINTIMRDNHGAVWLGSRDFGAYQLDENDQVVRHIEMNDGLPDNSVNYIYQDNEDNLWFGTYGGGLARLSTSMVLNWKSQTGLPNPNVYAIVNDKDNCIWIGTNGDGASRLCDNKLTQYTREDGLPHNKILSAMVDDKGIVWLGTLQGISRFKNNKFVNLDQPDGLSGSVTYHIIQASDRSFWIGTNNGLNHIKDSQINQYTKKDGLPNNRINHILESKYGGLWLASANGLTKFNGESFTNWTISDGLPSNFINDFYEDDKGGLWIASNNGLSYFINGQFKNWTKKEGLPHNNCTVILPAKDGNIWIGTSRGVAIFDGTNFTVITSREGLVFDLINRGAGYKDSQGNLWFGTGEGISRFSADFTQGSNEEPPIHILTVSNNKQQLALEKITKINQKDSSLRFNYTAISFQRASDVIYRYRLKQGAEWRETRLRELQIDSLAPGSYHFEVSAKIGKGKWNAKPASFDFIVTPPFWQTKWFLFLLGLSVITAFIYRNHRIKKYAIKLEKIVSDRTKQLEKVNKGLEWLANHDNLTRLANRNNIREKLEKLPFHSTQQLGIIILDLDYFKTVNDKYGHHGGDKALEVFAKMLSDSTNKDQLPARWGGEEFLIACFDTSSEEISNLAIKILRACRKLEIELADNNKFSIRCSMGFTLSHPKELDWKKTIQLADMALYEAKNSGRDCVISYLWNNDNVNQWTFERSIVEIESAIENNVLTKTKYTS